jgi:hypothetical protein
MDQTNTKERTVLFEVMDTDKDSYSESEMETAIEVSNSNFYKSDQYLKSSTGVSIMMGKSESSTAYSLVSGYHEGEGDMGGEKSQDDRHEIKTFFYYVLPNEVPKMSVEDMKIYVTSFKDRSSFEPKDLEKYDIAFCLKMHEYKLSLTSSLSSPIANLIESKNKANRIKSTNEQMMDDLITEKMKGNTEIGNNFSVSLIGNLKADFERVEAMVFARNDANMKTKIENQCNLALVTINNRINMLIDNIDTNGDQSSLARKSKLTAKK